MESAKIQDQFDAAVVRGKGMGEDMEVHGRYLFKCYGPDGKLKWEDHIDNVITTLGKNAILDAALAGSAYSAIGPFMGLISSVGYTGAPVAADTMSAHATWFEVDAVSHFPTVAARLTTNGQWAAGAGGSKSLTAALSFLIVTNGGTLKGAFLVFGTGAVATLGSTAGVLLSAGLFSGGDKVVGVGDTVQVSFTMSLT
jgi:hypothetical protein